MLYHSIPPLHILLKTYVNYQERAMSTVINEAPVYCLLMQSHFPPLVTILLFVYYCLMLKVDRGPWVNLPEQSGGQIHSAPLVNVNIQDAR